MIPRLYPPPLGDRGALCSLYSVYDPCEPAVGAGDTSRPFAGLRAVPGAEGGAELGAEEAAEAFEWTVESMPVCCAAGPSGALSAKLPPVRSGAAGRAGVLLAAVRG